MKNGIPKNLKVHLGLGSTVIIQTFTTILFIYLCMYFKDFIYLLDRERERTQAGEAAGRGRGRRRLPS